MRMTATVALFAVISVLPLSLHAQNMAHGYAHTRANPYAGGACAAPGYGASELQSPCCEDHQPCCDDVWAGYCQEKHNGFGIPCPRPFARTYGTPVCGTQGCGCSVPHDSLPPMIKSAPEPKKAKKPAPKPKTAPNLPPPPASADDKEADAAEGKIRSKKASAAFPVLNPAAWSIGRPRQ